jgi:hypothetical protein
MSWRGLERLWGFCKIVCHWIFLFQVFWIHVKCACHYSRDTWMNQHRAQCGIGKIHLWLCFVNSDSTLPCWVGETVLLLLGPPGMTNTNVRLLSNSWTWTAKWRLSELRRGKWGAMIYWVPSFHCERKNGGDEGGDHILTATELYTSAWLKWDILCYMYLSQF